VWIALDHTVWPWDQAWYGEVSLDLWTTLLNAPRDWPDAMTSAFGSKAPGTAWLGQFFLPLGWLIGDRHALLVSIVVCQIGSLALVFALSRRLATGSTPALAGTLVLGAAPLFVWTTHEYITEALQTLTVAWSLLLLTIAGRTWNPLAIAAQVPGVVGVAMLAKFSSPLYIGLPVAATVVLLVPRILERTTARSTHLRAPSTILAAAVSAIAVVGAVLWYAPNLDTALEHARIARSDTGLYGSERGLWEELGEWVDRLGDASFLPAVGVALAVVVAAAVAFKLVRGGPIRATRRLVVAAVCVTQLVLVVVTFATQPNEEARFLLPAVPFVAVVVALAVSGVPRTFALTAVALVSAELILVTLQVFGANQPRYLTYYRLVEPNRDGTLQRELERLVDVSCTDESAGRITIVGAEHPWFNANTLALTASDRNSGVARKCYYTGVGYAEADADRAWERIVHLDPPYYVAIDYGAPDNRLAPELRPSAARADAFNRVSRALVERVRQDPRFAVVPGSRRAGFVIFESEGTLR